MTDRETLFLYRLKQAEETLLDAEEHIQLAREFLQNIKEFTDKHATQ